MEGRAIRVQSTQPLLTVNEILWWNIMTVVTEKTLKKRVCITTENRGLPWCQLCRHWCTGGCRHGGKMTTLGFSGYTFNVLSLRRYRFPNFLPNLTEESQCETCSWHIIFAISLSSHSRHHALYNHYIVLTTTVDNKFIYNKDHTT